MTRCLLLLTLTYNALAAVNALAESASTQAIQPLPHAHAHNDYYHERPLLDALEQGFCSIEVDIFLADGKLSVGHSRFELKPERTLQKLYLDPLLKRVHSNRGWVFAEDQPITLLVDIKADGKETYRALREALKPYREMLSSVKDGTYHRRAVDLILSGARPRALVASQTERYVFLDGRLNELKDQPSPNLVPLVSENWNRLFLWRGYGEMPQSELQKLRRIVETMHQQERRLRFWGTPEKSEFWQLLADEGVDLIGTDDLGALKAFWTRRSPASGR